MLKDYLYRLKIVLIILFIGLSPFIILLVIISYSHESLPTYFTKHLTTTAREAKQEYEWTENFLADYEYYLRAPMQPQEFEVYCKSLYLKPSYSILTDTIATYQLSMGGLFEKNISIWWQCSNSMDSAWVWLGKREYHVAKYEKGYLYLYACHD